MITLALGVTVAFAGQRSDDNDERSRRTEAERFTDSVVRVLPRTRDGLPSSDRGFGIIVGSQGQDLYVVTPNHVVFDRDQTLGDRPYVRFRSRPTDDVEAARLAFSSPPEYDDLAVLLVRNALDRTPHVLSGASLLQHAEDVGTWVWTIGRETGWSLPGSHGSFAGMKADPIRQVFNGLPTAPGSSGAAVASSKGITGMVVSNTSTSDTFAISLDEIKTRLRIWGIPTNALEVGHECNGGGQAAASGQAATISFDGFQGLNDDLFDCYSEKGFSVAPVSGDWRIKKGTSPYVYFMQESYEQGMKTATLRVKAFGRQFAFQSVDLYASIRPIPYAITGYRDREPVFKMADVIPNTFGRFVTVQTKSTVTVDALEIELWAHASVPAASPVGVRALALAYK